MLFIFILSILLLGISVGLALGLSFLLFYSILYYAYTDLIVNIIMLLFFIAKPKIFKNNENVINSL